MRGCIVTLVQEDEGAGDHTARKDAQTAVIATC